MTTSDGITLALASTTFLLAVATALMAWWTRDVAKAS
jgi:hypothetical protein